MAGICDRLNLPTPESLGRHAVPKHLIVPTVVAKEAKKKTKVQAEKDFRKEVWTRDKHRSRASGKPLEKSGTDYHRVGEVHHRLARSTHPDRVTDPTIGVLLSKHEHQLAETPCPGDVSHCLLDIEGPEDMKDPHIFIFRKPDGTEKRRHVS